MNLGIRLNVNAAIVKEDKILVIEFKDENGVHYNLPGGGVDEGESIENALMRECLEEANVDISVGRLLLIWEYVPALHDNKFGPRQKVGHVFECKLKNGSAPSMPSKPDKNQTNVCWVQTSGLINSKSYPPLFPSVGKELIHALTNPNQFISVISRA